MLFNSLAFMLFLPIVFAGYWLIYYPKDGQAVSQRRLWLQNLFVVIASYVFYGWWDWRFLLLISFTSLWAWGSSLALGNLAARPIRKGLSTTGERPGRVKEKWIVAGALIVNLGILGVFKYYNFFLDNAVALLNAIGLQAHPTSLQIILPVGISFYTFQALSYVIDVYRGDIKPTKDVVAFLAFVSFFPQLVAGPIERATNLLPQFLKPRRFAFDAARHGLCLIAYGLFKKMVVADTLSQYVDKSFGDPFFYSSVTCIIGAVFFSLQIYCDFSGYSDVARGVARLFGFELMVNFDRPYLSRSFSEFWRRWHISLSSWFKDYVYIPLGGNRVPMPRLICNLWIVFLLSGLWHGASWAFIAWGGFHALYLSIGVLKTKVLGKNRRSNLISSIVSVAVVNVGAIFAWIFFRAGTIDNAIVYLKALFRCKFETSLMALCAGIGPMQFGFCLVAAGLLGLSYCGPRDCRYVTCRSAFVFIMLCIASIVFLGMPSGGEFIYFRF